MSFKTLGLDLGIASIGWALLSEENGGNNLEAWGSRIFQPGMDDDIESGKGVSRCAERRAKRALRVQLRRRRQRKNQVTALLQQYGFLPTPLTPEFFTALDNRFLKLIPPDARRQCGHLIPYLYRKKALDTTLAPEELGRAIYHLAQRRGYLSNRKQELKNEAESGAVKAGIDALKKEMAEAGARTLGEYFSTIDPEKERIRTRYTDRAMYQEEFRKICAAQRKLISEAMEEELYREIFFQRKLKSCKNLIGRCSIYPEEKRCSYLREEAQLFRIYTNLNHLRVKKGDTIRSLTEDERGKAFDVLNGFSELLTRRGTVTLGNLGKAVGLAKGEKFTLSDEEKEIYGNVLHAALHRVFGERAPDLSEDERTRFFNDLNSIEKPEVLEQRLANAWHLDGEHVQSALRTALPDDHCAYSLKALKEILPDLEKGIPLSTIKNLQFPAPRRAAFSLLPRVDSEEFGLALRNPVVHRTLTELRTVVNAIIARYGKPDCIRIELARDLKSTNKERERRTLEMRKREKERAKIAERIIAETGIEKPSRSDILKVMLADECDFTCPYTGKRFSMTELLHGKDIQIEHIIPYSRSFDDSLRNKTLCRSAANAAKNNRTPFEAFSGAEYEAILQRVKHFKGPFAEEKLELFKTDKVEEQEFLNRNLNDTRYASRLAMQYLGLLYGGLVDPAGKQRIFATSGSATALIRRGWGGNYLLGEGEKVRSDHRHHAIDALTVALTTPEMVRRLARLSPEQRKALAECPRQSPIPAIFDQAAAKLEEAAVSHHVINKLRGALHKETIYGKDYGNSVRHKRINLKDLKVQDLAEIVDPAVKQAVLERLNATAETIGKLVQADLKKLTETPLIFRDRRGNAVNTIKAVRVAATVTTRTVGSGDRAREVANGSNYLLAIFAVLDAQGREINWEGEVISLFDARARMLHHQPLFEKNRPGRKFKFTLKKGDIVRWHIDGKEQLCIIRGVSLPQFYCIPINDARMKKDLKAAHVWYTPVVSSAFKGRMKKYRMNLFGELQDAND